MQRFSRRILDEDELVKVVTNCVRVFRESFRAVWLLTNQLRELERDGILRREVFAQIPPKVEYSLTLLGESLGPVIEEMCRWGVMFNLRHPCGEELLPYVADVKSGKNGTVALS